MPNAIYSPLTSRYATTRDMANLGFNPGGYPGSSGGWATDRSIGASPLGGRESSPPMGPLGYPGDRYRTSTGVQPIDPSLRGGGPPIQGQQPDQDRMTALKAAYERGDIPFEKLFEQYQLPSKYPEVSSATGQAFGDVSATDKGTGVLDFNALKDQFGGANNELTNRYNQFQQSNDITGFSAGQRAADAAAAAATNEYATTARSQLGDASGIIQRYRTEGQGALDAYLQNAQDFYNKDIGAALTDAGNRTNQFMSRYGIAHPGGASSALAQAGSRYAVQAALPFQLQGRQYIGDALSRYQPFYGDVAARDYNRVSSLNVPTEQNIYASRQGDILRSKGTEQQLQNLDMMVKERGFQGAIQNLRNQGIAPSMINQLVSEWQRLKGGSLALTGQAAGMEQQFGGERGYNFMPGSGPIAQPQYYGLPQPNFPNNYPGRYNPQAPAQPQPAGGPGGWSNGKTNSTTWQGGPAPMTQADIVAAYGKAHPQGSQYGGQSAFGTGPTPIDSRYPMGAPVPAVPPQYNPQSYWPEYDY